MPRAFLLSPARVSGARAGLLLNSRATFALALTFRREGLPLAEIFTFASGLYFRGKITYARSFARKGDFIKIITANKGLLEPTTLLTRNALRKMGETDIHQDDPAFHQPLSRDARILSNNLGAKGKVILLGSIATAKYTQVLLECFGTNLLFPEAFVGRGDMSRGGLLLRAAREDSELSYIPVAGSALKGKRAKRVADL